MQKLALILAAFITSMMMMGQVGSVNGDHRNVGSIATGTVNNESLYYGNKIPNKEFKTITCELQQHLDSSLGCPRNRGFPIKDYE